MTKKHSDQEIQADVMRELSWDTRVSPNEVGVQVQEGTVTLTGQVDSWAKRVAAENAAHRVAGVLDVANDLEVRLPGRADRSDTEIAHEVRRALEWDVMVPDEKIRSTVSDGIVTLEGEVPYWSQVVDAAQAIERLAGVKQVRNQLQVRPSEPAKKAEVQAAIQNALERHADREAARIDVKVDDGAVELSGAVNTWAERVAVIGAARGTRGVRNVREHLLVKPFV